MGYFLPFYLPNSPKNQNLEKVKKNPQKTPEILPFYNSVTEITIIFYTVPQIWCVTDVIIFHFGPFFYLFTNLIAWKIKVKRKKKNAWRYHHFRYVCQKVWSDDDGRMDRWKKWHIEVGAPPKNMNVLKNSENARLNKTFTMASY